MFLKSVEREPFSGTAVSESWRACGTSEVAGSDAPLPGGVAASPANRLANTDLSRYSHKDDCTEGNGREMAEGIGALERRTDAPRQRP